MTPALNFCSVCGHAITLRAPEGDNRVRACCDQCGAVHYVNPKMVVGTVPMWGEQVLLCRRAIEPRRGFWTLPAGFLEAGETAAAGAQRETAEEAGARIVMGSLFTMYDVVHVQQIHLFYLAQLVDTDFVPGIESLEVKLFDEADIPWDELAFRTITATLKQFFEDRRNQRFELHTGSIEGAARTSGPIVPAHDAVGLAT
jgi:ADP-ribose pyrophosphatase YjhB (NUDIX family)